MKTEIKESIKEEKYPYLGIYKDTSFVVLFSEENKGIVVHTKEAYPIGHYSEDWDESLFQVFNGTVELSN